MFIRDDFREDIFQELSGFLLQRTPSWPQLVGKQKLQQSDGAVDPNNFIQMGSKLTELNQSIHHHERSSVNEPVGRNQKVVENMWKTQQIVPKKGSPNI